MSPVASISVDGPTPVPLRVLEHGAKRGVRRDAAHAAVGRRVEMRIADLQDVEDGVLASHDAHYGWWKDFMIRNYCPMRGDCLTDRRALRLRHL